MCKELVELYKENAESYRYFLEWRFRIYQRFGILVGVALVIAKFIYESHDMNGQILMIPSALLALGSALSLIMDLRNRDITQASANLAKDIEIKLSAQSVDINGGFYKSMLATRSTKFNYSNAFAFLYSTFTLIGAVCLILSFLSPEFTATVQENISEPCKRG